MEIVSGGRHLDWVEGLLDDCSEVYGNMGIGLNGTESESLIAVSDGSPVGIVMFDRIPSFRINVLYSLPGHQDAIEPMLRSIIAMAIHQGMDSVTVHSVDYDGTLTNACRRAGFKMTTDCPCCQREGAIFLRCSFQRPQTILCIGCRNRPKSI